MLWSYSLCPILSHPILALALDIFFSTSPPPAPSLLLSCLLQCPIPFNWNCSHEPWGPIYLSKGSIPVPNHRGVWLPFPFSHLSIAPQGRVGPQEPLSLQDRILSGANVCIENCCAPINTQLCHEQKRTFHDMPSHLVHFRFFLSFFCGVPWA